MLTSDLAAVPVDNRSWDQLTLPVAPPSMTRGGPRSGARSVWCHRGEFDRITIIVTIGPV